MKKTLTTLMLLICGIVLSWADGPFRTARYDGFKVLSPKAGSILMIGNSITDMHIWQEVFRDANGNYLPICNRGNSGSYSTEQSENIESYIANGPSKVFLMIGTNDIATSGGLNFTPEQVLSYVKSMVTRIHRRSPSTHIYLYPILNNNTGNRVRATWLHYNEILKDYINTSNDALLTFVDIYDALQNLANGGAWSNDNLHPNAAAYKIWCHAILPYLGENVTSVYDDVNGDLTTVQRQDGLTSMHGGRATMFSVTMPRSRRPNGGSCWATPTSRTAARAGTTAETSPLPARKWMPHGLPQAPTSLVVREPSLFTPEPAMSQALPRWRQCSQTTQHSSPN